jgi:hypothetical protein
VQAGINQIQCPTTSACYATDPTGAFIASLDPSGQATSWTTSRAAHSTGGPGGGGFGSLTCPSTSFCAATYSSSWNAKGEVLIGDDPTTQSEWNSTLVDSGSPITSISCASSSFCAAGDEAGGVRVGQPASSGTIAKRLARALTPPGNRGPVTELLRHNGITLTVKTPAHCQLEVDWRSAASGTSMATGNTTVSPTGVTRVHMRLTRTGRTAIRHGRTIQVSATAVLSSAGNSRIHFHWTFSLAGLGKR